MNPTKRDYAHAFAAGGLAVFPIHNWTGSGCSCGRADCGSPAKHPRLANGFHGASTDAGQIDRWWSQWPDANPGIATGRVGVFDVDPRKGGRLEALGSLPATTVVRTGGDGWHVYFLMPEDSRFGNRVNLLPGIDFRGHGGYVLGAGSDHSTGGTYGLIETSAPNDPPAHLLALIAAEPRQAPPRPAAPPATESDPAHVRRIRAYIAGMAPAVQGANGSGALMAVVGRLVAEERDGKLTEDDVRSLLDEYNARCEPEWSERELNHALDSARRNPRKEPLADRSAESKIPDHLSDASNGRRFVQQHGRDLRFCSARGWLEWDGRRWSTDNSGSLMRKAKASALSYFDDADRIDAQAEAETDPDRKEVLAANAKAVRAHARHTESESRLRAMITCAESELPVVVRSASEFDADPLLLNVANGTLCLRTGTLRPHERGDMITKVVDVAYLPGATAPRWAQFVEEITIGDTDLARYLQRAAGYALTGRTDEQCLQFLHGGGRNGKGVFIETLRAILGPYAASIPFTTLLKRPKGGANNDVARLAGIRLAVATEAPDGEEFDEPLVKALTGEDTIAARFLFKEFFDLTPQFKIWITGNHRPTVLGNDAGIWSRIRLIPFRADYTRNPDKRLKDKLRNELPGILAWAVAGCLQWQVDGLSPPECVVGAGLEYRRESDVLGRFITECCQVEATAAVSAADLFQQFKSWLDRAGERTKSGTWFGRQLTERGFGVEHRRAGNFRTGLRLSWGPDSQGRP